MNLTASRLRLLAHDLPRSILPTIAISAACALVVTYLMRIGSGFAENLIFSLCIGTSAMVLINGGRH